MTCCTGCCFHDPDRGACTYRGQGCDQCWPGGDTCPCRATGHVSQADGPAPVCTADTVRTRVAMAYANMGRVILYVDQAASYAEVRGLTDRAEGLRDVAEDLRAQRRKLRQIVMDREEEQ